MNFNDYSWHDVIINNIEIDRSAPGIKDRIVFEIEWPEIEKATLIFEEVYWAEMKLNFGIVAEESISNAVELDNNNQELLSFYSKWNGAMDGVKLKTYRIELNSTGSEIKIIAKIFKIEK